MAVLVVTMLVIPTTTAWAGSGPVAGATYTVVKGDNLSSIALRAYGPGNAGLWPAIWGANAAKIPNPNALQIGTVLEIPDLGVTAVTTTTTMTTWTQFQTLTANITDPYDLIDWLDARPEKVDHPMGGWIATTGPSEVLVVWTGSYIADPSYGGRVSEWLVDVNTGVWKQHPGTTVVWETPGGSIRLSTGVPVTDCVKTTYVIDIINTWKCTDPNQIYVRLDELANVYPGARHRTSGPASYQAGNTLDIFWVQEGQIQGHVLALDCTEGKCLYLNTSDGLVQLTYAHSGLHLCSDVNPARDFPTWWGKGCN